MIKIVTITSQASDYQGSALRRAIKNSFVRIEFKKLLAYRSVLMKICRKVSFRELGIPLPDE